MPLIYVFSEQALNEALAAYVEEATAAYPDSAALIHIVDDAIRDYTTIYIEYYVHYIL